MIVGFTTTCTITVYFQQSCEFETRSRYNWNIVESGVRHHNPHPQQWHSTTKLTHLWCVWWVLTLYSFNYCPSVYVFVIQKKCSCLHTKITKVFVTSLWDGGFCKLHSPVFRFLVDSTNLWDKVIYTQWLLTSNDKNDQICDVGFCRMHSPVSCFFVYKSNLGNKIPNNIKHQTTKRNI